VDYATPRRIVSVGNIFKRRTNTLAYLGEASMTKPRKGSVILAREPSLKGKAQYS
jgi:hypothetical protein